MNQARLIRLFRVCPGLLLSIIDSSILATSLYTIGIEFHDHSLINWVVLAYTLGYTGFTVSISTLSDVVGRRNAFVASYILFLTFSIACGCARQVTQLIICRAFQGIGGSGLWASRLSLQTKKSRVLIAAYRPIRFIDRDTHSGMPTTAASIYRQHYRSGHCKRRNSRPHPWWHLYPVRELAMDFLGQVCNSRCGCVMMAEQS